MDFLRILFSDGKLVRKEEIIKPIAATEEDLLWTHTEGYLSSLTVRDKFSLLFKCLIKTLC